MRNKKNTWVIITLIIISCVIMAVVDGIIQPGYVIKSAVKIVLFLALPLIYSRFDKSLDLKSLFKLNKKSLAKALALGIPIYAVIVVGYLLLKDVFDFSAITGALTDGVGVNRDNFVFVSLYISFINSLLEEFFFRGFAFLSLKKLTSRKFSYIISTSAFALYHVAMMIGWFSPLMFIIVMAGLFVGGAIFNLLNEKSENVYTSWLVHAFANFGINTVGFILFGII